MDKIRRRERIEKPAKEPLFNDLEDTIPLFFHAAMLDSLHDMWRMNAPELLSRLGVLMGHKLRVELGDKMDIEEVGTWEAAVEQVPIMLEFFSDRVEVAKISKLYARIEREGCPCMVMQFSMDYCPQDMVIDGMISGFVQRTLDRDDVECSHKYCGKDKEDGLCVHELKIKEE